MADRQPQAQDAGVGRGEQAQAPGDRGRPERRDDPPLSRYAREVIPRGREQRSKASELPVLQVEAVRSEPIAGERKDGSLLPVPARPTPEPPPPRDHRPFWKRIGLSRPAAPAAPPASLDPLLARVADLEKQIAASQAVMLSRLDGFEENITRLWEIEEQLSLSEVRERLALIEATQEEIADSLHAVSRNLSILAVVLALALAAGLLGLGFLI